jgi:glycogen phosphorylase
LKAAVNGVQSLSILDGWWVEGHIEGITGWSIGEKDQNNSSDADYTRDADSLYNKSENVIVPLFYNNNSDFIEIMRYSIALNGSFFNTQRMIQEYVLKAYL